MCPCLPGRGHNDAGPMGIAQPTLIIRIFPQPPRPGRHFINQYPGIVSKVDVRLVKDLWTRVVNKDSHGRMAQHNHAFVKVGPHNTYTQYVALWPIRSVKECWVGWLGRGL